MLGPQSPAAGASPPQIVHRYRLLRRIARGGMAEVYLAAQRGAAGFERKVALKRILPVYAGMDEFTRLFRDEARISAALDHSNIVQVQDFGLHEGELYIAMEYVDGPDLEELLDRCRRRGILPPVEFVLYLGHRLACALEYAHSRLGPEGEPMRIVHRDVSPPNVLLGVHGEVKLTDFGVARAALRDSDTRPGVLRGKYAYMSPEQVGHRAVDHRSDIFSLGTLLYETLTGVNPFEAGTDYQTMEAVERAELEPAGFLRPDTPAELDRILVTCLEPDPEYRYGDASELRQDLASLLVEFVRADEPESLVQFLGRVFPERMAGEARGRPADGGQLPWEPLAHRLSPLMVPIPDRYPLASAGPIRLVDRREGQAAPLAGDATEAELALPPAAQQAQVLVIKEEISPEAADGGADADTDRALPVVEDEPSGQGAIGAEDADATPRDPLRSPVADEDADATPRDPVRGLGADLPEPGTEPAAAAPAAAAASPSDDADTDLVPLPLFVPLPPRPAAVPAGALPPEQRAPHERPVFQEVGPRARKRRAPTGEWLGPGDEEDLLRTESGIASAARRKPGQGFLPLDRPPPGAPDPLGLDSVDRRSEAPILGATPPGRASPVSAAALVRPAPPAGAEGPLARTGPVRPLLGSLVRDGDPLLDSLAVLPARTDDGIPIVNEWELDEAAWEGPAPQPASVSDEPAPVEAPSPPSPLGGSTDPARRVPEPPWSAASAAPAIGSSIPGWRVEAPPPEPPEPPPDAAPMPAPTDPARVSLPGVPADLPEPPWAETLGAPDEALPAPPAPSPGSAWLRSGIWFAAAVLLPLLLVAAADWIKAGGLADEPPAPESAPPPPPQTRRVEPLPPVGSNPEAAD